jgi:hypothetical protein
MLPPEVLLQSPLELPRKRGDSSTANNEDSEYCKSVLTSDLHWLPPKLTGVRYPINKKSSRNSPITRNKLFWLQPQGCKDVRTIESCCGIAITTRGLRFRVTYKSEKLDPQVILGCISHLRQQADTLIHSLDGNTDHIAYCLYDYDSIRHAPKVHWRSQFLSYDRISKLGWESFVHEYVWRLILQLCAFLILCAYLIQGVVWFLRSVQGLFSS